mgnify:CR=1 FL=1
MYVYGLHNDSEGTSDMAVLTATYEPTTTIFNYETNELVDAPLEEQEKIETIETPEQHEQHMLVTRALDGDNEAFSDIVAQYSALMLRTAYMIVGDRDVAEDAVQDALIQAWNHLPSLRESGALRPWLMRIVVNQCISFKRRLARSTAFILQSISEQETNLNAQVADDYKGRMERGWDLAQAIEDLPSKQRAVIVLHYYHGMTLPEMARTLQISENTLKKRIQAALANLRRVLRVADADMEDLPSGQSMNRFVRSVA